MTSSYLERPLRSLAQMGMNKRPQRDHQPDIVYQGDALRWARDREVNDARFFRRQIHHLKLEGRDLTLEDRAWVKQVRRCHSKAVLNAREYDRIIAEREIWRRLVGAP